MFSFSQTVDTSSVKEHNLKLTVMSAKNLIGGLLAGAAVGVAIGVLLAPDSGAKTQKRLAKRARKLSGDLRHTAEDSIQSVKDRYNSKVDEVAKRSKDGINTMSERIKA